MKTDFSFNDEYRDTLDGLDGSARGWVLHKNIQPKQFKLYQSNRIMVWVCIVHSLIIGNVMTLSPHHVWLYIWLG